MPKIIICNDATEQMLGTDLTRSQHFISLNSAWRHMWYAENGDVIVVPILPSEEFFVYLCSVLEIDRSTIRIVALEKDSELPPILSDESILDSRFVERLRSVVSPDRDWSILAYYYSSGVEELAEKLNVKPDVGHEFIQQRGVDLFNRKVLFRRMGAGAALPLAAGGVAYNAGTLCRLIKNYIDETGKVIIKKDSGAGGGGNVAVTNFDVGEISGASKVYFVGEDSIEQLAERIWSEMSGPWNQELVVESHYEAEHILYFEFEIPRIGASAIFLNNGILRMTPANPDDDSSPLVWTGFEIPAVLPPYSSCKTSAIAAQWAKLAGDLGYWGKINIDMIVTKDGDVIVNEINGRLGGCSHIHVVAEKVLGKNYGDKYFIRTRNKIKSKSIADLLQNEALAPLFYTKEKAEGVILLVDDSIYTHEVQYMVVSRNPSEADELEDEFLNSLQQFLLA